ncbi:vitamin K epoxide reductase family protein [Candidatus Microgenomates bacterium]|nr:vitamin K epoxide reductase family protein [Candidatus Microgenomates bacterium]
MTKNNLYRWTSYLALVGVGLAIYLLYEYLAPVHQSICYLNSTINCEATTKGVLSNTLGVPTPLWGLTGYLVIFFAALRRMPRLLFGMATFGLLFCLRITYLEVFVIKVICPVCVLCQLVMIAVFLLGLKVNLINR